MSDADINGGKVRAVGHCQYTYGAWKVFPPFFFFIVVKQRPLDFNLNAVEAIGGAGPSFISHSPYPTPST